MDREQAKFILQSFRPDGADAPDADFADALQLAAGDRVLGEWLADERATDAAFASALCEVEIPDELREQILAVMHGEDSGDPEMDKVGDKVGDGAGSEAGGGAEDEAMDSVLIDAMESLQPPAGLRDQILVAMSVQQGQQERAEQTEQSEQHGAPEMPEDGEQGHPARAAGPGWFTGWARVTAIAAALVLGAFVAFQVTTTSGPADGPFESYIVQHHAGRLLNASFELDVKETALKGVDNWLISRDLPVPKTIPERLRASDCEGCKVISLPGGKSASMVCFREDGGDHVYLVVAKNDDISDRDGTLPKLAEVTTKDCYHCPETKWNVARWRDAENTYILLVKKEASRKDELIRYF